MELTLKDLSSQRNPKVRIKIMKGHFATEHTHVNTYIDISSVTNRYKHARETAALLIENYQMSTRVDTIVCLDGTRLIGAFMAEMLGGSSLGNVNSNTDISVITPEVVNHGQMIFRDNTRRMVEGQNILILSGSITTGENLLQAISAAIYYKGKVTGICAIFSHLSKVAGMTVHSAFSGRDIPDYKSHRIAECPLCQQGRKLDALVNSYGYSLL